MSRFSQGMQTGFSLGKSVIDGRRESQERELQDKANAAAREAYSSTQSAWEKSNQPQTSERLTLGATSAGNDAGMQAPDLGGSRLGLGPAASVQPDSAGLGARMGLSLGAANKPMERETVTTPAAKWDEDNGREAYHSARSKFLMENKVDPEVWMKDWTVGASIRAQRRQEGLNKAFGKFGATGDAGDYIKTILPMFDAGLEVVDAKPNLKLAGGGDGWQFTFKDKHSGEDFTQEFTTDQIRKYGLSLQDPKFGMNFEGERLMEMMKAKAKADAQKDEDDNLYKNKKDLESHKHGNDMTLEDHKAKLAGGLKGMVSGDKRAELNDPSGGIKPGDMIKSIDSKRRDITALRTAAQKDFEIKIKSARSKDRVALTASYEQQVQQLDQQLAALDTDRAEVSKRLGLGGASAPPAKAAGSTASPKQSPSISGW